MISPNVKCISNIFDILDYGYLIEKKTIIKDEKIIHKVYHVNENIHTVFNNFI